METDLLQREPELAERLAAVFGEPNDPVQEVERRAARLLPGRRVIVWECDPGTFQFSYVSPSAEAILGYARERWLSQPDFWVATVVHPQDRPDAVTYCAFATGQGRDHDFRYRARAISGETLLMHDVVHVIKGARGVATRLRGIMIEVAGDA